MEGGGTRVKISATLRSKNKLHSAWGRVERSNLLEYPIDTPGQVDRCWTGGLEALALLFDEADAIPCGLPVQGGHHHAVGPGDPDQWCAPYKHLTDSVDDLVHGGQIGHHKLVGQLALVDRPDDRRVVGIEPAAQVVAAAEVERKDGEAQRTEGDEAELLARLPFALTRGQEAVIADLRRDLDRWLGLAAVKHIHCYAGVDQRLSRLVQDACLAERLVRERLDDEANRRLIREYVAGLE